MQSNAYFSPYQGQGGPSKSADSAYFLDIMPYNTTAIPPRREPTGQTQLPLSRVRKMIGIDQDIHICSNAASFVITLATEMFIQYLAEQGHNVVKAERKPRRNIQYRDLSNAIAHLDNLEFLIDVVPKTVPYKEIKEKKAGPSNSAMINGDSSIEVGQTTLDGKKGVLNGTNGFGSHAAGPVAIDDDEGEGPADPNAQLEMEIRGANRKSVGSPSDVNGAGEDIEMH